ncbi:MAG TPA: type VI secretion system tip protein TssI/VgrG [Polyangiales bacterium]
MRITVDSPISGPEAFVFERMHAHEELGRPYLYNVYLLSSSRSISLSSLLGEVVTIHVEVGPGKIRHFGGHVTRAVALGGEGRSARYRLELRPWLSLLQHSATCRIWQKKTVVDVLKDVASKAGYSVGIASQAILQGPEWEYLVQYRESDFNFFTRLCEQEGLYFFIKQEKDKHELLLTDHPLDHESSSEGRRIAFMPPGSGVELTEDVFEQWTPNEALRTTHYELDDHDYKDARADLFARSGEPTQVPKTGTKGPAREERNAIVYDYPGEYLKVDEGNKLTTIRQQELRVDRQTVSAGGNVRDLTAGSIFTLTDHPNETQNEQWAVVSMDLNIEAPAVESGKDSGQFVFRGSYALLSTKLPFRLRRTSVKPSIPGLQTAVVVGPKGEEIHTDSFGRVRVKFRWDRTGSEGQEHKNEGEEKAGAEDSSCWIRVAQPWASSGFGIQFIPRVNDEVIVQFIEGDPDRPLITGSLYNSVNTPPYTLVANKTQSGIKTRSSKGGSEDNFNEIRFEDKKDEEELFVQAERNHTVNVKKDRSVSVGGNETYSVTGTRSTTITKKNTDTYKDEHAMDVTGKVTETFHNEHTMDVTAKQTITLKNDKQEDITGAYNLTTNQKFLLTQGGTTMKFEGNAVDMDIKAPLTITRGAGTVTIDDSGSITLESSVGIVFKSGGSTVEITPTGVSLSGTSILATAETSSLSLDPAMAKVSGMNVNVEAQTLANVCGPTVKLN